MNDFLFFFTLHLLKSTSFNMYQVYLLAQTCTLFSRFALSCKLHTFTQACVQSKILKNTRLRKDEREKESKTTMEYTLYLMKASGGKMQVTLET